jgi:hypothetical protein
MGTPGVQGRISAQPRHHCERRRDRRQWPPGRLPATIKRKDLLGKGISFDVTPDEAASFDIALVGKTKSVTLARAGDATLADATLAQGAGKRTVKLKLTARLKRAFTKKTVKLELRIVAYDAAGNRTVVTKPLRVH